MLGSFVHDYPHTGLFAAAAICLIVGYFELRIIKSVGVAAFSWLFGVVAFVAAIKSVAGGGVFGWGLAALLGVAMVAGLAEHVRRWRKSQDQHRGA